jgi:hypothetical protein
VVLPTGAAYLNLASDAIKKFSDADFPDWMTGKSLPMTSTDLLT